MYVCSLWHCALAIDAHDTYTAQWCTPGLSGRTVKSFHSRSLRRYVWRIGMYTVTLDAVSRDPWSASWHVTMPSAQCQVDVSQRERLSSAVTESEREREIADIAFRRACSRVAIGRRRAVACTSTAALHGLMYVLTVTVEYTRLGFILQQYLRLRSTPFPTGARELCYQWGYTVTPRSWPLARPYVCVYVRTHTCTYSNHRYPSAMCFFRWRRAAS